LVGIDAKIFWRLTNRYRDISWSLIQNPALWAFAVAQGRDGLAFMQAFRAMRRGFANGTFRYAVMAFQK
jgi:tocopherol O-methyltransferase